MQGFRDSGKRCVREYASVKDVNFHPTGPTTRSTVMNAEEIQNVASSLYL